MTFTHMNVSTMQVAQPLKQHAPVAEKATALERTLLDLKECSSDADIELMSKKVQDILCNSLGGTEDVLETISKASKSLKANGQTIKAKRMDSIRSLLTGLPKKGPKQQKKILREILKLLGKNMGLTIGKRSLCGFSPLCCKTAALTGSVLVLAGAAAVVALAATGNFEDPTELGAVEETVEEEMAVNEQLYDGEDQDAAKQITITMSITVVAEDGAPPEEPVNIWAEGDISTVTPEPKVEGDISTVTPEPNQDAQIAEDSEYDMIPYGGWNADQYDDVQRASVQNAGEGNTYIENLKTTSYLGNSEQNRLAKNFAAQSTSAYFEKYWTLAENDPEFRGYASDNADYLKVWDFHYEANVRFYEINNMLTREFSGLPVSYSEALQEQSDLLDRLYAWDDDYMFLRGEVANANDISALQDKMEDSWTDTETIRDLYESVETFMERCWNAAGQTRPPLGDMFADTI